MTTRYSRFRGGRKLLRSTSVEIEPQPPAANACSDEETIDIHRPGFDDAGPGNKKQLKRRSCLVIGGHTNQQSPESYLFSLLKSTLAYESLLSPPPAGENSVRSHGDHPTQNSSLAGQNGALTLHDFARLYHTRLPVTVHMRSGNIPDRNAPPPPAVDVLTISTDAPVVVCIYKDVELFHLPLDAEMRFALLYDPCDDLNLAVVGMVFYGVTSLLHSDPMPKVVCARTRWKHYDTSIAAGEILVVKGMHVKGGQVRGLSVFSVTTKTDKTLPLKCRLQLTTQPKYVFLPLSDIAMHVPDPFPCRALVLGSADGPPVGMEGAVGNVVTLNEVTRATVLTCSVPREGQPNLVCAVPVALPNVDVVISTTTGRILLGEGCSQMLCENGQGQAEDITVWESIDEAGKPTSVLLEEEEVWERIDEATFVLPQEVGTDSRYDRQAETIGDDMRRLTAPLPGQSQGNLKQAVEIDPDYEDMGAEVIMLAPNAPTQAQGHKGSKRVADRNQDYEDLDGIPNNAHPQTMGKAVSDSNLHMVTVSRQKGHKGTKHVDEDYVYMADEDVLLADHPTETSATPDFRHGRAGSGQGGSDGSKEAGHFAQEYAKVDHTPDELGAGGEEVRSTKPLGWIYNYEAANSDAECDDMGFERCNSSVLRDDDEYVDLEQGDMVTAMRAKGER